MRRRTEGETVDGRDTTLVAATAPTPTHAPCVCPAAGSALQLWQPQAHFDSNSSILNAQVQQRCHSQHQCEHDHRSLQTAALVWSSQPLQLLPLSQQERNQWRQLWRQTSSLNNSTRQWQQLRHMQPLLHLHRQFHHHQQQQLPQQQQHNPSSDGGGKEAAQQVPGSAFTTLPNLLSLSRVAASPWLAYCIAVEQWPVAVALTAAAGVSMCMMSTASRSSACATAVMKLCLRIPVYAVSCPPCNRMLAVCAFLFDALGRPEPLITTIPPLLSPCITLAYAGV